MVFGEIGDSFGDSVKSRNPGSFKPGRYPNGAHGHYPLGNPFEEDAVHAFAFPAPEGFAFASELD